MAIDPLFPSELKWCFPGFSDHLSLISGEFEWCF